MREIKVKVWDKKNKVMFPNKKYLVNFSMNLKGEWEIIREGLLEYKEMKNKMILYLYNLQDLKI